MHFIAALFQATTLDEAFAAYERQMQALGVESVMYTFVPQIYLDAHLSIVPLFKTSGSYSPGFLKHYQEAGFEQHDFTVKKILQGESQLIDWWGESRKCHLSKHEQNIVVTAREDYGIRNGMTIPLQSGIGIGGISCISADKDAAYQRLLRERAEALFCCAQLFHAHVMTRPQLNAFFMTALLEKLSVKERRLLPFLITGLPMKTVISNLPKSTYS